MLSDMSVRLRVIFWVLRSHHFTVFGPQERASAGVEMLIIGFMMNVSRRLC